MTSAELLVDGLGRIREAVADVLSGLTPDQLAYRIDPGANPISWPATTRRPARRPCVWSPR